MTSSKFSSGLKALVLSISSAALLAGCFKPQGREGAAEGAATFYNDKVSGSLKTLDFHPGFSIPLEQLFTFNTCLRDRRTNEALAGHRFKIEGATENIEVSADNDGCIVWSERVRFNFLGEERYVPLARKITGAGLHKGTRSLKIVINPWNRSGKAIVMTDLSFDKLPEEKLVPNEQAELVLKGMDQDGNPNPKRPLFVGQLPVETAAVEGAELARKFKIDLAPELLLKDIEGQEVKYQLKDAKLKVQFALIETIVSAGKEKSYLISKSDGPIEAKKENDRFRAEAALQIVQGNTGSKYYLAVLVEPVDGPEGLEPFEGKFEIGDLKSITDSAPINGSLSASNGDESFAYEQLSDARLYTPVRNRPVPDVGTSPGASPAPGSSASPSPNTGSGNTSPSGNNRPPTVQNDIKSVGAGSGSGTTATKIFRISKLEPAWSGPVEPEFANRRTVMYTVKACIKDMSNGGRPAVDVEFEVIKADKTIAHKRGQSSSDVEGCIEWEDKIEHSYFAPEKWIAVPVTIRHKASGFEETRTLHLAPWERWNFTADPVSKGDFIREVNARPELLSRIIADGVEFNSTDVRKFEVDDFLSLRIIKPVALRIPLRVWRPSNILARKGHVPEPLRSGRYLLRAAYVVPMRNAAGEWSRVVSPMRGLNRIVDVVGGEIRTDVEFPVSDIKQLTQRAYVVFEVLPLDEAKLAKNDPYLMRASDAQRLALVDRSSKLITPTFVGALWLRQEKDGAIARALDLTLDLPTSDSIDQIPKRDAPSRALREAVRPLAGVTIESLYGEAHKQALDYATRMREERRIGTFLGRSNLEYVPLYYDHEYQRQDDRIAKNNRVLPNGGAVDELLKRMNVDLHGVSRRIPAPNRSLVLKKPITKTDLLGLIRGQVPADRAFAARLCVVMMRDMSFAAVPQAKFPNDKNLTGDWVDACLARLVSRDFDHVFTIEKKLRVLKLGSYEASKLNARDLGFDIGADIGFGRSKSMSQGWSIGWGPSGLIGEISKLGMLLSKASGPMMTVISAAPGALAPSIDISRSYSNSASINEGGGMGSGTHLNMEQLELGINLAEYEECAIIRPRVEFIREQKERVKWLGERVGVEKAVTAMMRGLYLCTGAVNKNPVRATERYYTFVHLPSDTTMIDAGDARSVPWLLTLRGQRDYSLFLMMAAAQKTKAQQAKDETIDLGDFAFERLATAFERYFRTQTPSYPGLITLEGKVINKPAAK